MKNNPIKSVGYALVRNVGYIFENVVNEWLKVKAFELKPIGLKTITN